MSSILYHLNANNKLAVCTASVKPCPYKVHMTAEQWDVVGRAVPKTREQQWGEQLADYRAFVQAHGYNPAINARDKAEARSGTWLKYQRDLFAEGKLSEERLQGLNAVSERWAESLIFKNKAGEFGRAEGLSAREEERWRANLAVYSAFLQQHGRDPQTSALGVAERKVANWLNNQRQATRSPGKTGVMTDEREAALTAVNAQWLSKVRKREASGPRVPWQERYGQLAAWLTQHGAMPRVNVNDSHEKQLGVWLLNQKHAANGKGSGRMTEEHLEQLNTLDPNWLTTTYRNDAPKLMLEELRAFTSEHKAPPRASAPKGSPELKLYLRAVKRRNESSDPDERAQLERLLPRQPRGRKPKYATELSNF